VLIDISSLPSPKKKKFNHIYAYIYKNEKYIKQKKTITTKILLCILNSRASIGVRSLSVKNAHKRTNKTRTRRKNQKSENQNRNFNRRRIRRRKRNGAPRPVSQTQHASLARAFVGPSALQSTLGPAAAEL